MALPAVSNTGKNGKKNNDYYDLLNEPTTTNNDDDYDAADEIATILFCHQLLNGSSGSKYTETIKLLNEYYGDSKTGLLSVKEFEKYRPIFEKFDFPIGSILDDTDHDDVNEVAPPQASSKTTAKKTCSTKTKKATTKNKSSTSKKRSTGKRRGRSTENAKSKGTASDENSQKPAAKKEKTMEKIIDSTYERNVSENGVHAVRLAPQKNKDGSESSSYEVALSIMLHEIRVLAKAHNIKLKGNIACTNCCNGANYVEKLQKSKNIISFDAQL